VHTKFIEEKKGDDEKINFITIHLFTETDIEKERGRHKKK
jgi:hypothetical protein